MHAKSIGRNVSQNGRGKISSVNLVHFVGNKKIRASCRVHVSRAQFTQYVNASELQWIAYFTHSRCGIFFLHHVCMWTNYVCTRTSGSVIKWSKIWLYKNELQIEMSCNISAQLVIAKIRKLLSTAKFWWRRDFVHTRVVFVHAWLTGSENQSMTKGHIP